MTAHPSTADITASILVHRELFRSEMHISRLVSRQPPTSLDPHTGVLSSEPAAATGMTMSGALLRRLGHPEGYGMAYPWTKALWLLRVECRRKHPHHRSGDRPYWRGALCHQAVRLVVVGGDAGGGPMPPYAAGKVLRVDRMAPLLVGGFRFIEQTIDDFRERAERREREDTGRFSISESAVPEHRPLDGLHRIDCPQCRKHAA